MSTLSNNIRYMRMMRGLSQKQFAALLNKSPNAVSNWEKGATNPDVELLEEICKILKVTPNQIYGWDECQELKNYLATQETLLNHYDDLVRQREALDSKIREYAYQLRVNKFRNSNDL